MVGLVELAKFVQEGGTLIVEGSTSMIFPAYGLTSGVTVEEPNQLFVRGSVMRGMITDKKSPLAYGFDPQVPVYFIGLPLKGLLAIGLVLLGLGTLQAALVGDLGAWMRLTSRTATAF